MPIVYTIILCTPKFVEVGSHIQSSHHTHTHIKGYKKISGGLGYVYVNHIQVNVVTVSGVFAYV